MFGHNEYQCQWWSLQEVILICNKNAFQWDAYHTLQGVSTQGVSAQGGCLSREDGGVCLRDVYTPCPLHVGMHTPLVNRITDKCKNITYRNFVCRQ